METIHQAGIPIPEHMPAAPSVRPDPPPVCVILIGRQSRLPQKHPPMTVEQQICHSTEEIIEANREVGWETEYRQLEPGPYIGQFDVRTSRDLMLISETSSTGLEVRGDTPVGYEMMCFFAPSPAVNRVANNRLLNRDGDCLAVLSGSEFEISLRGPTTACQLLVRTGLLAELCERLRTKAPYSAERLAAGTAGNAALSRRMIRDISQLARTRIGSRLIAEERANRLIGECVSSIFDVEIGRESGQPLFRSSRRRVFCKARDWIHAHADSQISIADVCEYANVSERTLQRLFQDFYGLTPQQYIYRMRLHTVRQALCLAEPTETTVLEVITSHGFFNQGRFAAAYTEFFAERPRETLDFKPSSN